MSRAPRTLTRNDRLEVADELMHDGRFRHLPVLNERAQLVGIVSQRDLYQSPLLRALGYGSVAREKVLRTVVVKEVMTTDVVTATPDMPLAGAARTMRDRQIGCLPVLEGDRLVGILTEGDFVGLFAEAPAQRP